MFSVPEQKRVRVILDADAKNEADDQYAIVHALLTPKFDVKGLIGAHYGSRQYADSMNRSYEECRKLVSMLKKTQEVPVYRGASEAVKDEGCFEYSEGAKAIVEECMAEDERPLFVAFTGPITDLACAWLAHPEIAGRMTAIWIGGGAYPDGGLEFNLSNDVKAANIVFQSDIDLWQVPVNVYSKMMVSLTELEMKVAGCGEVGDYLFRQLVEFNDSLAEQLYWPTGESWCLGDSPVVGLMMDQMHFLAGEQEAPAVDQDLRYHFSGGGRKIRVYHDINDRFILEDFYAKIKKYARKHT